jgi:predicted membrane protein DUF2339
MGLIYLVFLAIPILVLVAAVESYWRVRRVARDLRALQHRVGQLERLRPLPTDLTAVPLPGAPEPEAPPAPPPATMPMPGVAPALEIFLILWGWTSGRFGAGVLVAAGAGVGLGVAWRGDRMRRTLQGIGHALIGVGCGVVYLSLYLGHFTLHVLPVPLAFGLLGATSVLIVLAGLRYRVQTIAAIGIIGAFLPQGMAAFVPLQGFRLEPAPLLTYLGVVDALVLVLASYAGWSALALASLLLTSVVWIGMVPATRWSWPIEIGLSAVFALLGLAPVPRPRCACGGRTCACGRTSWGRAPRSRSSWARAPRTAGAAICPRSSIATVCYSSQALSASPSWRGGWRARERRSQTMSAPCPRSGAPSPRFSCWRGSSVKPITRRARCSGFPDRTPICGTA